MGAEVGMESAPLNLAALERALFEEPAAFDFFQAVHLLERLQPERAPLGGFGDPEAEVVRIGVNPRLAFPAGEVQSLEQGEAEGGRPEMRVNFMGLTGPSGVLPYPYATLVLERLAQKDAALAAFLDLFHHRIVSLFYLAWEKHRFALRYGKDGTDPLTRHLRDLAGLGLESEARVGTLEANALAAYAGLLGPEPRSAVALERLVSDYFGINATVEQFVGRWYPVAASDHCLLDEPGPSSSLGLGALVGDEVWDPQGAVRLCLGPLGREAFDAFLPGGHAHEPLATLLELFGHGQFAFEVQLVLAKDEVGGLVLGDDDPGGEDRLGWNTWISTRPRTEDAGETILSM